MAKKKPKVNIKVDRILEKGNITLRSQYNTADERLAVMSFVEDILHETDNYRGFQYLYPNELPAGVIPGINIIDMSDAATMSVDDAHSLRFANTDPTRIRFL